MRVFVLCSIMLLAVEGCHESKEESKERPRALCDRILDDAWMLYYSSETHKRSFDFPLSVSLRARRQSAPWPWLLRRYQQRLDAQQELAQEHALELRGKRDPGLVDECCLKLYFISELLNYC